jgi:hypothetical protein
MPDNPNLMDEKNIPANWQPVENPIPAGAPAPPVPHDMPQYFSGSLSPALQHDTKFVGTEMASPRIPKNALMPLGNQANPFSNAAAESTSRITAIVGSGGGSAAADVESIATNKQTGSTYDVQVNDRDTLITFNNNLGGIITLPGPNVSTAAFFQAAHTSGPDTTILNITNNAGNMLFLVINSQRAAANTTFAVSDSNNNVWRQLAFITDPGLTASAVWYAEGVKPGANAITVVAVHGSGGASGTTLSIVEYSGIKTLNSLDTTSFGGNTSVAVVTITPNDLVVFGAPGALGGAHASAAPWTGRYNDGFQIIQDQIVTASQTMVSVINATTPNLNNGDGRVLAAFKPAGFLPDGFLAGWYTYIQNTGTGTFLLRSTALIDNSSSPVTIGPASGLIVVYDGTNWFTERGIQPSLFYQIVQSAGVSLPQEPKLNFSSSFTVVDNPGNGSSDVSIIPAIPVAMRVNGIGVATDKEVDINGVKDFAAAWGVKINGTLDGG